jgi:hypothetical protein
LAEDWTDPKWLAHRWLGLEQERRSGALNRRPSRAREVQELQRRIEIQLERLESSD